MTASPANPQRSRFTETSRLLTILALVAIMGAGAYLRCVGSNWDDGYLLHPDERFLAWVTSSLQQPDSLAAYFDTRTSTFNPNNVGFGFYVYGTLPIFLGYFAGQVTGQSGLFSVFLPGRALAAAFDLLTILMIFLTARRLFDRRVGLLAAALYAFCALPIQLSHFYTVDTFTNFFVSAALLFIARALERHHWIDYPLFGLALGAGMASKVSVFPLALLLIVALALRVIRGREEAAEGSAGLRRAILIALAGLVIAGLVTVITFRVAQPYAFLPPHSGEPVDETALGGTMALLSRLLDPIGLRPNPAWLGQMQEVRRQVSGYADIPPNHQWGKRIPILFPLGNMARVGMGWPLGVFVWLATTWALWEIVHGHRGAYRLAPFALWSLLILLWQGTGWVTTMRYFLPIYGSLVTLAAWALITLWDRIQALLRARGASRRSWPALVSAVLGGVVVFSTLAWGFAVSRIYTRPHTRIAASYWIAENVPSDVTLVVQTETGQRRIQVGLVNDWLNPDTPPEDEVRPAVRYSSLSAGARETAAFSPPFDGVVTRIRLNHVLDPLATGLTRTLHVALAADSSGTEVLAEGVITAVFEAADDDPRGAAYDLILPESAALHTGQTYYLILQPDAIGPLVLAGASIATEGQWDDPVPQTVNGLNLWGAQYQGYELQMFWEDFEYKRERLQFILDHADYLTISSNRFYDSLSRNPQRYPMSIDYYEALFNGELGFELVANFTSRPALGPIEFNDDRAEEAWTVYDHPRVMVFRKTADYSPQNTAAILGRADLDQVVRVIARESQGRPVRLRLPAAASDAAPTDALAGFPDPATYDPTHRDLWSRIQPLTVIAWWLVIAAIGWLAFPILYVLLPGLPDRGYPLARVLGLLITAWLAWLLASAGVLRWGAGAILAALLALALASAALAWPRRAELIAWLRGRRGSIIRVEIMLGVLYLAFVLIRLGNPDLWHPYFGGEKPMDLAYLNAVLNSTRFPPYDPWFAGSTIKYYYFGFVIVGLPIKLLGIPSTLAYNLVIPTLFALTGGAAFSAAYNLIAPPTAAPDPPAAHSSLTLREALRRWPAVDAGELAHAFQAGTGQIIRSIAGTPQRAAGVGAMLMAVVLGNLGQIRTALWALAELGAGEPLWAVRPFPALSDMLAGLRRLSEPGTVLPLNIGQWYWNATRIIPVPIDEAGNPLEVGPISEFPFFTFLYADLHAHMIALMLTLLVVVWGIGLVRGAVQEAQSGDRRSLLFRLGELLIGALTIGALRATNTWDWPTYVLVGLVVVALAHARRRADGPALACLLAGGLGAAGVGLLLFAFTQSMGGGTSSTGRLPLLLAGAGLGFLMGYAAGVLITGARRADRRDDDPDGLRTWITLPGIALQGTLVVGLGHVLFLPYHRNTSLQFNSFYPWTGSHVPAWTYLFIHGLPLFIIASWLAAELIEWLRADARTGRLARRRMVPLLFAGLLLAAGAILLGRVYPVLLIVTPLIGLALVLYVRPGQVIEKRLVLLLMMLALALSVMVEVIVIEGDIGRMNTVFKFYLQVWMLLAVSAGAALGWLWPLLRRLGEQPRTAWAGMLALLVFLAGLYPLLATRAKVLDRWAPEAPHTLDGMAYMPYATRGEAGVWFSLQGDYYALRWLQDSIAGAPVVLEAHTVEYNWGSRVSIYTGLPTVIGWSNHQRQQRPPESMEVGRRAALVQEAYDTPSIGRAREILEEMGVDLIMVGELERAYYDPAGLAKFDAMARQGYLRVIYDRFNTVIYQVIEG
ncbi:MAG: hypothetical protein Kow00124_28770 [Anaerolineae bacterium]